MAVKRRRNAGQPKLREHNTVTRNSAKYAHGQQVASKLIAGRKLTGSQSKIRKQIHALIRKHGSKSDIALLTGNMFGEGSPDPYRFRQGVASVAADLAGFDGASSGRSRAARSVTAETKRDKKDTKRAYKGKYSSAMAMSHGEGISLGDAWEVVKGEMTLTQAKEGAKANPRRKKQVRKSKASRKARSKRRNPVNFYDLY
jgi:hypothetical protein